jgi:probable rRNA maturation factor
MTYVVDVDADGVRVPLARRRVAEIASAVLRSEGVRTARLSIAFIDRRRIALLNRRHLGHRGTTDVISFGLGRSAGAGPLLGDIYIAPEVARRNAIENGVSIREELTRLVVHGVLHVIGLDHPEGDERRQSPMWRKQERLVRSLVPTVRRAERIGRGTRSAA